MKSCPRNRRQILEKLTSSALVAITLISVNCGVVVPRQGWNEGWGPLVPHDTFPGDCGVCHVPQSWDVLRDDFSFDHEGETGYPLVGSHVRAACLRCHNDKGPVLAYVERGCGGCHTDPHQSTLGLECTRCHNQSTWRPSGLVADHARTQFPLVGAHAVTPCVSCHPLANVFQYRGAPYQCEFCHQDDLARTTDPDHIASGWTSDCGRCHIPTTWLGAGFNHGFFPLVGGHAGHECSRCHTGNDFAGTSPDCYSCHQDDYEGATVPDHVGSNFSRDCSQCHSVITWRGATFNHNQFPLRGPHGGKDCTTCHQGGNTSTFTCLVCHEHSRERMDDKHREENGYQYESTACLSCHPTGRG